MDIMWKSPLLTADKRISAREMVGVLGGGGSVGWGWKGGRGSGGWKGGRGDMCVQLCINTEQLLFVLEYNWPKMVAVIKRYMTLRQLIGKKVFVDTQSCIMFFQIQWNLNSRG